MFLYKIFDLYVTIDGSQRDKNRFPLFCQLFFAFSFIDSYSNLSPRFKNDKKYKL